jgi:hypothetical protein
MKDMSRSEEDPGKTDARRLTPAAAWKLALLAAAVSIPAAAIHASPPRVILNEVHYHPGDDSRQGEFVEILNHGPAPADISGWILAGGIEIAFPPGTVLAPGAHAVVAADPAALAVRHGLDPSSVLGPYGGSLSNGGEDLELWTSGGYLASFVSFRDEAPWPESPDGLGPSLERISPLREDADPEAWAASVMTGGTPGAANSARIPETLEPSSVNLVAPGATWRYFRGESAPPASWREVSFDDAGWESGRAGFGIGDGDDATVLGDMQNNYVSVFIRHIFEVADPAMVESLILTVDYDDGFIAYLNGEEIARENVDAADFDEPASASHEAGTPEDFAITSPGGRLRAGPNVLAIQGHNNGLGSGDFSLAPSLAASILPPGGPPEPPPARPPRDIRLNEVLVAAGGLGWIELHNPTGSPVDAGGRRVRLDPPSLGSYSIPSPAVIPQRGFLVIQESSLGFPLTGAAVLILTTADGRWIDGLNPRTAPAGMSTGTWPEGSDDRYVFTTPTPGAANVVSLETRIVLNEIQYHPAGEDAELEFVELHNRSASAVDVSGWSFTRGIEYTIPAGTSIAGGGFLVVARDPAAAAAHYGITTPLGPYLGALRNDAETILLRDALGNPADRVRHADEGSWPEEADGGGPSVELIHPSLENRYGPAWAASDGDGTPGRANSRRASDPTPIVAGVSHAPVVPEPDDEVLVTASITDERSITSATLFWQRDGGSPASIPMADDGASDDRIAGNGVYGARIPPQPDRRIIQFWIEAVAQGGQRVTVPASAPAGAFLYQVEGPSEDGVRPLYRVVMRSQDLTSLRTRGNNSDVLLGCTFIAAGKAYHRRGIRYRGSSARSCDPLSYRIQFDHDVDLDGIQRLNVNGCATHRQWIGLDFLSQSGIPTPLSFFRRLSLNGAAEEDIFLRLEAVDEQFIERVLPEEDEGGNLYRGVDQANLDYRGEGFSSYRSDYEKHSNEDEGDWSDIVDLSFRFDAGTTSDQDFPAAIEEVVDVDQWALYFAAYAVLGSTENSILLDNGDDYFLYRRPSDGKWILLPWDLDSCFDQEDQVLFRPTVDQIERFLEHPRYAPLYWCHLERLLDGPFDPDVVASRLEHLDRLFGATRLNPLRQYAPARYDYIASRISPALTATVASGGRICGSTLEISGASASLEGRAPACGTTDVLVNGEPATYNPLQARWTASVSSSDLGPLRIVARDRDGFALARMDLVAARPASGSPIPASITSPLILRASQSPHRAAGTVTVSSAATLTIEPGTHVILAAGARIEATGRLLARGTSEAPIVFETDGCPSGGEGILLRGAGEHEIAFTRFQGLSPPPGASAAVTVDGSAASFDGATFTGPSGATALEVRGGGMAVIDGSFFEGASTGIEVSGASSASIDRCIARECGTAGAASGGGSLVVTHLTASGVEVGFDLREASPGAGAGSLEAVSSIVWASSAAVLADPSSTADITFSDLSGGVVFPGEGNLSADPRFLDAGGGDFRLSYYSPCRRAGKDATDMGAIPFEPTGETASYLLCDTNGDGSNDVSDCVFSLLHLFSGGREPPCAASRDCNGDGKFDLTDPIFDLNHLFAGGLPPRAPYPACDAAPVELCEAPSPQCP